MNLDVAAYCARHRARQAQARAVQLHPTQLSAEVVGMVREAAVEVHAWEINDTTAPQLCHDLELPWATTDDLERALPWRSVIDTPGR